MRLRQKALKSIAGRMETLADEAEKRAKDPFSKVQPYLIHGAYGGLFGMKWPEPLWDSPGVEIVISGMRGLAKIWKDDSIKFGGFLEAYSDRRMNLGIPLLLCRVCMSLHITEPICWDALASLFTCAFEASGKKRSVSADSLRKTWKKRGKKMLRSLLAVK